MTPVESSPHFKFLIVNRLFILSMVKKTEVKRGKLVMVLIRSTEEHSGASSSVSTTSSGVYPPSNLQLDVGRRRSCSPQSETESGECSEGEMSDLTPCNASPSLTHLLSWSGNFELFICLHQ